MRESSVDGLWVYLVLLSMATFCTPAVLPPAAASENGPIPEHLPFYGVWQIDREQDRLLTADGSEPPLLPAARKIYQRNAAALQRGVRSWDPVQQCNLHGVPRLMYEHMPFQILETRQEVLFMFQWNREFRMIDLNIPHQEPPGPQFQGQSVGHWEGHTLVIDSNAFDPSTYLDADGMPHSDQLHVVERYSVSPDRRTLTGEFLIEDPKTFTRPWRAVAHFRRLTGVDLKEDVCVDRLKLPQYQ